MWTLWLYRYPLFAFVDRILLFFRFYIVGKYIEALSPLNTYMVGTVYYATFSLPLRMPN